MTAPTLQRTVSVVILTVVEELQQLSTYHCSNAPFPNFLHEFSPIWNDYDFTLEVLNGIAAWGRILGLFTEMMVGILSGVIYIYDRFPTKSQA